MNEKIRLRYAPSPTGFLHIGNTRTALFNYLMAKHYDGTFIVRIEDTDIERNVPGAIESQFANLKWIGIEIDESMFNPNPKYAPYTQLERLDTYQKYAEDLLNSKKAYRCFCTHEELETMHSQQEANGVKSPHYDQRCYRLSEETVQANLKAGKPFNVRFHVPENHTYKFDDMVRGEVSFEGKDIGDWVIIKSNKIPTYNYAVVIDDKLMDISHVVRGEEHISNTPKQLMVFEAFGWKAPIYGHLTLIVNEQRKKLSKRDGNIMQFIEQYRNSGYLPEAMFNFISLLGWSPKEEHEIYDKSELIKIFDEKRWSKSPSMFDVKKLQWMNNDYIKRMSETDYLDFVKPYLAKKFDLNGRDVAWVDLLLLTYQKELVYGEQIQDLVKSYFVDEYDEKNDAMLEEIKPLPSLKTLLLQKLSSMNDFKMDDLQAMVKEIGKELAIKGKDLFMPIRIFATHQTHGPELYKVMYLLGKDRVLANIARFK